MVIYIHHNTETYMRHATTTPSAAYTIAEFARQLGISRTTMYTHVIGGDYPPIIARIGDRVLIVESPEAYLRRVATAQTTERQPEAA